jgi:hypothetical protein
MTIQFAQTTAHAMLDAIETDIGASPILYLRSGACSLPSASARMASPTTIGARIPRPPRRERRLFRARRTPRARSRRSLPARTSLRDIYWIAIWVTGGGTSAQQKDHLLDIGVDPAGGSSYTAVISDIVCGETSPL